MKSFQPHRRILQAMLFGTFVCLILFVVRCWLVEGIQRMGIYTNILLAWIPYLTALVVDDFIARKPLRKVIVGPLLQVWLLFLPNAAYIITDLVHWRKDKILPVWYDWIFISAVAWVGLFLAFLSVQILHRHAAKKWGGGAGWLFVLAALSASSFGIYAGRFFRWNSWDALIRQQRMFGGLEALTEPETAFQVAGFCVAFTVFSLMIYVMLHAVSHSGLAVSGVSETDE